MRRMLLMVGLLAVVTLVTYGGPTAVAASETCTATCSGGATLSCTVASGTCSSAAGMVTCCGQTHNCNAINAWDTCQNSCQTAYNTCFSHCTVFNPCVTICVNNRLTCQRNCGAQPTISFSC
jgi:hypothetical protein